MPSPEMRDGKHTGYFYGEVDQRYKGGPRFRRRFETLKEAKGYEAFIRAAGHEPANLKDAKLGGPTFSDWLALMRASKEGERVRDPSGGHRLDYLNGRLGHMTMPAITTTVLDKEVAILAKRPAQSGGGYLSKATINRYLAAVSSVFKFAQARQKAEDAPIVKPAMLWSKKKGGRIHWFSVPQEQACVAWLMAQGWLAEALTLRVLCATGLRWSEFESLEPHQCTSEWILLDDTKTDTPRDVPLDAGLASELKAMVVAHKLPKYGTTRTRLKQSVKACGYNPLLGLHNARHGAATRMVKLGIALPIIQEFLGHKNIATTMKYIHVENSDKYEAMKKLSPQPGYSTENDAMGQLVQFKKSN